LASELVGQLSGYSGNRTSAFITIEDLQLRRRLARAVRTLGLWWGAGVVCVFIPIAHFVLVPSCLVGGLAAAGYRLSVRRIVTAARATCPDCGVEQELDILGAWRQRSHLACRACHRALRLHL
jgi:hypothetical protein